jgi:heptosyltransferase III
MKILLVKRDKIGDMLLTTPLLSHLRRLLPDARIDVLANDYNAWVAQHHPAVDRLWVYPRTRHAGRLRFSAVVAQMSQQWALRSHHYDVAIAANGDPSPRAIARAISVGARRTIAYCDAASRRASRLTAVSPPPEEQHEIERLLGLAAPVGEVAPLAPSVPHFTVPGDWRDEAHAWLAAHGVRAGGYLVVGLGARYEATQPSVEQVLRWAAHAKQAMGWDTVVHYTPGGASNQAYPGSEALAFTLRSAAAGHIHLMPPRIDLAIAIVGLAGGNVIPDGGLMHFAAISPGGVVGLFATGATLSSPARWGPRGHNVAVVDAKRQIADVADDQIFAALRRCRDDTAAPSMAVASR